MSIVALKSRYSKEMWWRKYKFESLKMIWAVQNVNAMLAAENMIHFYFYENDDRWSIMQNIWTKGNN